jgi:integral membrane sensor domain MASE1
MRHLNEPTYSFVILTFILILVNTVLNYASAAFLPSNAAGIAYIFPAAAFMVLFALWYGGYGAFAAYVGGLIGGILAHENLAINLHIAVIWAVAGLLQVLIPLIAARSFEIDLSLPTNRDVALIVIFGVVINNLVGAAWGAWTLGLMDPSVMVSAFSTWLIGNVIVCLVLVPLCLRLFTPRLEKKRLFVKNYWD